MDYINLKVFFRVISYESFILSPIKSGEEFATKNPLFLDFSQARITLTSTYFPVSISKSYPCVVHYHPK